MKIFVKLKETGSNLGDAKSCSGGKGEYIGDPSECLANAFHQAHDKIYFRSIRG